MVREGHRRDVRTINSWVAVIAVASGLGLVAAAFGGFVAVAILALLGLGVGLARGISSSLGSLILTVVLNLVVWIA